ncbi:hypothetical protein [Occallatibacter savannae]|uniref:hypothetical protein n=1 Tax=Occallatibacter savannae TaxID=1002691 RepID=UPI000D698B1E|nr:hypothetical protein [Occallatibacter savannae]
MPSNPYKDLAEILEGTLSLVDYYEHRMSEIPSSLAPARAALEQAIGDLRARLQQDQAAD